MDPFDWGMGNEKWIDWNGNGEWGMDPFEWKWGKGNRST